MGKQIRFFATAIDYYMVLECVINNGWILINNCGDKVPLSQAKQLVQEYYEDKIKYLTFFATKEGFNIFKHFRADHTFMDMLCSEVIEISACSPLASNIHGIITLPNQYEHGRIWYEKQYYDNDSNIMTKNDELDKMYNLLVRMIKRKSVISADRSAYILPDAYRLYKEGRFIPCSGKNRIVFGNIM